MRVVTISVEQREKEVPDIQRVLTKYGENIFSRVGYHNIGKDRKGLIVIIYTGKDEKEFCEELKQIENVKINCMEI